MIPSVDLIIFGIQAGIRLAQASRQVYVEHEQNGKITLPLPGGSFDIDWNVEDDADNYRLTLKQSSKKELQDLWRTDFCEKNVEFTGQKLVQVYLEHVRRGIVDRVMNDGSSRSKNVSFIKDYLVLAQIRQWDRNPNPSALERLGGALVGIAVDYYAHVPGAMDPNGRYAKTLRSFLLGLSDVPFQDLRWDGMLLAMFSSGLETLNKNPDIYSDDGDQNLLLRTIVSGVTSDVKTRLDKVIATGGDALSAQDRMKLVAPVVLSGLLTGSSRAIVNNPEVLGIKDTGGKAVVTSVGTAFLDLLLADLEKTPAPDAKALSAGLRRIASTDGLDKVIHAALKAVAENPGVINLDNDEVNKWLKNVVSDLYKLYPDSLKLTGSIKDPDFFAAIAYVILDRAKEDLLPLAIEGFKQGEQALLTVVAGDVLSLLIENEPGKTAQWKKGLTNTDVQKTVESLLGSIAEHPEWIVGGEKDKVLVRESSKFVLTLLAAGAADSSSVLKTAIRAETFGPLISAALSSGLPSKWKADGILLDDPQIVAFLSECIGKILGNTSENGIRGLDTIMNYETLHDLFIALKEPVIVNLIKTGTPAERDRIIKNISAAIELLRLNPKTAQAEIRDTVGAL